MYNEIKKLIDNFNEKKEDFYLFYNTNYTSDISGSLIPDEIIRKEKLLIVEAFCYCGVITENKYFEELNGKKINIGNKKILVYEEAHDKIKKDLRKIKEKEFPYEFCDLITFSINDEKVLDILKSKGHLIPQEKDVDTFKITVINIDNEYYAFDPVKVMTEEKQIFKETKNEFIINKIKKYFCSISEEIKVSGIIEFTFTIDIFEKFTIMNISNEGLFLPETSTYYSFQKMFPNIENPVIKTLIGLCL